MSRRLRSAGIVLALVGATLWFGRQLAQHEPLRQWLFWHYLSCWLLCALFGAACLCGGHLALRRLGIALPAREHLTMSFAAGVVVFFLGLFVFGLLRLYGVVFFFAWPLLLIAAGGRSLARLLRRMIHHSRRPSLSWWQLPVAALGLLGVMAVYFTILAPNNIGYDARWYHLAIAEHYAAHGGVTRFPEGWYAGTLPHLASYLYTWAFLLPRAQVFHQISLAQHLEFTLFLATLAQIPVLVRRLVPRARAGVAFGALFLFPGIFIYDSNLIAGADHVAALFAIPIFLALLRAWRDLEPRACVLLAAVLAGALLTKYQAFYLIVLPTLALGVRAIMLRRVRGSLLGMAAGLVLTAPHWLKNIVWYRDPFYPFLHRYVVPRPWTPDSAAALERLLVDRRWQLTGSFGHKLHETVATLWSFSFRPHDFPKYHGALPVFGSLFTLSLLVLPFLRPPRRIWALYLAVHAGVFAWFWTYHEDRYLQILLPWMAAGVAAVLILIWREGWAARAAATGLVGLQIIWGADTYFIPTQLVASKSAPKATIDLLAQGLRGDGSGRYQMEPGTFQALDHALPRDAHVLLHELYTHLGLRRESVTDTRTAQGGISNGRFGSARELYDALHAMGVTHLVWEHGVSRSTDSIAGDLRFFQLAFRYSQPRAIEYVMVAPLPAPPPPPPEREEQVLMLDCGEAWEPGLYAFSDLHLLPGPRNGADYPAPRARLIDKNEATVEALLEHADFLVINVACRAITAHTHEHFTMAVRRGALEEWIRTSP